MRSPVFRIACVLPFLLSQAVPALAQILQQPRIQIRDEQLAVSLAVDGALPNVVLGALEDGIGIQFIYEMRLRRRVSFFLLADSTLLVTSRSFHVRYDFLERRYLVEFPGTTLPARSVDRQELAALVSRPPWIELMPFRQLVADRIHYLEARFRVSSVRLYPPFSLITVLSRETDWITSEEFSR